MDANRKWIVGIAAALLIAGGVVAAVLLIGGGEKASAQTIRFQKAADPGPSPFTAPSDIRGKTSVQLEIGAGPFGGTGSDLVCDRELLIRSLLARPDRLRAWANVAGINPTPEAVSAYIRSLTPVTLTRDTRITNHTFEDGRAVGFQSILAAGTAVLVNKYGEPVARCRCGNPLTKPIFYATATCLYCPPHYTPPPPCDPYYKCYKKYPNPPGVKGTTSRRPPTTTTGTPSQPSTSENPSAYFNPSSGHQGDQYTLYASGFAPNTSLRFTLTRPDGVTENYEIRTGGSGSGSYSFNPSGGNDVVGTYSAVVTNPNTGASASASTQLLPSQSQSQQQPQQQQQPGPGPGGGETSDLPSCAGDVRPCRQPDGSVLR
jgi:hypothetical protein